MSPAPPIEHSCDVHAGARAGWRCGACGRQLCPECVGSKRLRNGTATLCMQCGGLAAKITRPRRILPYWEMFPQFLSAMLSRDGFIQMVALGGFLYLVSWLPGIAGWVAVSFVWITYFFQVIAHSARGEVGLPEPGDFLGFDSIYPPIIRFLAATALIWLPGGTYALFVLGFDVLQDGPSALLDPVLFALVFVGLFYFPAAIIAAAVADSVLAVINPMITVRMILRLPGQYAITWAVWAGLSLLDIIVSAGLRLAAGVVSVPIFSELLVRIVSLYIPIFSGFVLGRFIYQNAEQFGLLGIGDDVEEVWPEAVPGGQIATETHTAHKRDHQTPVAVDGWDPQAPATTPPEAWVGVPQPSADPSPWAPSTAVADHGPIELDLDEASAPGPAPEPVELPDAPTESGLDVVHDTQAWLTNSAAGPGAPWTVGSEPGAGAAWTEDEAGHDTELELDPGPASLELADGPSLDLADDLTLDGPPSDGGLLGAAQVGPASELRPGSAPAGPMSPPTAEVVSPVEIAATVPVIAGSRLHEPPGVVPETEDPEEVALRAALEKGDADEVLARFRARSEGRYPKLVPRMELRLAGILERAGDYSEAVKACRRAAADEPEGPFAPRALYTGGRIFAERLQDPARARVVWAHLVETFPHDQLAELARAAIGRLG